MRVYSGNMMRNWPYGRKLVPSFGHRFPKPKAMGTEAPTLQQNQQPFTMPVGLVRVALVIAAGAVAWKLYEAMQERRMEANLPSFPGIGPLFNVGAAIGPAYNLGPWII